jgi:drug/metabolite transporter (DMT)-like permease
MTWFSFALIAAILVSATSLLEKRALKVEHAAEFSAVLAVMNAIISIPLFFMYGVPNLTVRGFLIILLVSVLGSIAYLLSAKSVRHLDISLASPFFVLAPGINAFFAYLFLGEALTAIQVLGLFIMLGGSYILQLKPELKWRDPIKEAYESKYIYLLLTSLLIYSATSLLDRYVLTREGLNPGSYLALVQVFIAINFIILLTIFYDGYRGIKHGVIQYGPSILMVSVLTVGYRFAQVQATALAYIGLVSAVKRSSSLFTTLIGGEIFHEKGLLRKTSACIIMIAGLALLLI